MVHHIRTQAAGRSPSGGRSHAEVDAAHHHHHDKATTSGLPCVCVCACIRSRIFRGQGRAYDDGEVAAQDSV